MSEFLRIKLQNYRGWNEHKTSMLQMRKLKYRRVYYKKLTFVYHSPCSAIAGDTAWVDVNSSPWEVRAGSAGRETRGCGVATWRDRGCLRNGRGKAPWRQRSESPAWVTCIQGIEMWLHAHPSGTSTVLVQGSHDCKEVPAPWESFVNAA